MVEARFVSAPASGSAGSPLTSTARLRAWAERASRFAWWPLPALAAFMVALRLMETPASFPWVFLQAVLQVGLVPAVLGVVVVLAARAFLQRGQTGLLLLGSGAIVTGLAGALAAGVVESPNAMVTVHNLLIWIAAWLHFVGAWIGAGHTLQRRARWLLAAYAASIGVTLLVAWLAMRGQVPPFFVQGEGGTPLRQLVLGSAVALFAAAGVLLLRRPTTAATLGFRRWYACGLFLIALGLAAVWLQTVTHSLLGWTGILSQCVGALYLMAAALIASPDGRGWAIPFSKAPQSLALRYALAPLCVGTAAALRLLVEGAGPSVVPYEALLPAVLLAALYGGVGPGLLSIALALLVGEALWFNDALRFSITSPAAWTSRAWFAFSAGLLVMGALALQRALVRAQAMESQVRWRALFDTLDHGVCVCEMLCDHTGHPLDYRFLEVNPAFGPMTGLRDAQGKTALELVPQLERRWIDTYARAALKGETLHFEDESVPMGRRFEVFASPIDSPRCFVVRFADVTERRRAEARLAAAAARDAFGVKLAAALRPLGDPQAVQATAAGLLGETLQVQRVAYFELRDEHYVVEREWNDGMLPTLVGKHPVAAFGQKLWEHLSAGRTAHSADIAEDPAYTASERAAFAATRMAAHVGVPLVKNGRLVAGLTVQSAQPRAFSADEVTLVEDTADATWASVERARSEAALREADRRKDEFIATLAHELRNPLAPVRHAARLLAQHLAQGQPTDPARQAWAVDVIERQVQQMSALIDDLLDVSRIARGLVHLNVERVPLDAVLRDALEISRPLIEAHGHQLTLRLPEPPVWVRGDRLRLAQVFSNLLSNAAKYSHKGSRIEVVAALGEAVETMETGADGLRPVTVRVRDHGVGIDADTMKRIFEPFAQGPHATPHSLGGLGIGLSLVKRLVELHGGRVWATSDGPGHGSEFWVRLPQPGVAPAQAQAAPLPAPAPPLAQQAPVQCLRVLVVDDNRDAAESLGALLSAQGHEVREAFDGVAALALGDSFEPDAVVLDIGLPGQDGWTVGRAMRERVWGRRAQLIALTGWGQPQDQARSAEAGFDAHLVKPVDPDRLLALLAAASASRGSAG